MTRREKYLETIKKMIIHQRSAEAIGSIAEAAAFAEKITELRARYQIEMHEVEPSIADHFDFSEHGITVISRYSKRAQAAAIPWQAILHLTIAEANGCQCILITGGENGENNYFFVAGTRLDRVVVIALSGALCDSAERLVAAAWAEAQVSDSVVALHLITETEWKESYLTGFLVAIDERLQASRSLMLAEDSTGTALVKLDGALEKSSRYLKKQGIGISGETSIMQSRYSHAEAAGYEEGKRASLGVDQLAQAAGRKGIAGGGA